MEFRSILLRHLLFVFIALSGCEKNSPVATAPSTLPVSTAADKPVLQQWLTDITHESGLDFVHDAGVDGSFFMPEIVGSGAAMFDYDNDGDLDIYGVNAGSHGDYAASKTTNHLYAQEPSNRFVDRTVESGLGDTGYGMGVAVGDMDNDGDLDLFVSNYGADVLYRNNGDGSFTDITRASGIDSKAWSTSAMFFDYDVDGFLDLFVTTYVTNQPPKICTSGSGRKEYCGPNAFDGTPDLLFHNNGDGSFTNVSRESGIGAVPGKGLGTVASDFNSDGRADIFVANDGEKNHLWVNMGDGQFSDQAVLMGTAYNMFGKPEASMGIALGDSDGDLALDLFVTHLGRETNTLYRSLQQGGLQDTTAMSGLGPSSLPYTGFGTGFLDADHDGDLDLVVVNGRVTLRDTERSETDIEHETGTEYLARFRKYYSEPNQVYLNDGTGRFEIACETARSFCDTAEVSRSLVLGDIDNDGDLDVLVTNANGRLRLYRNDGFSKAAWIKVVAWLPDQNRDAIGALVYAKTADAQFVRPITHSYGYLSTTDATAHFGLGDSDRVEQFSVVWPDGTRESFPGADAGRTVRLNRGAGTVQP